MAYDNGQSSSWRKKRNSIVIEQRVTEPQQILVEGERQAMVQSNWSIEQDKEVGTVELMCVAGSLVLLIFKSLEERKKTIESKVLDTWLENVMDWSPTIAMPNRRVWVSVCGIPIHAWSVGTFKNLAERVMENVRWVEIRGWGALSSADVGLRQSLPELDTSDDKSVVPNNHMSNSPIWHMNRLWEDNMLEDWRVLESSIAESGKRNREVPGIGTALVVAEVDELV
ncbi:hypothetical protein V6N12_067859 [Hibiscus sabdariffa]|uniref:DUF4283 domain-containing protein n=1 Tax=Hibiscus sabdariffa TaxID=183260 RepID=A0ABR2FNQ4_9ROSI